MRKGWRIRGGMGVLTEGFSLKMRELGERWGTYGRVVFETGVELGDGRGPYGGLEFEKA